MSSGKLHGRFENQGQGCEYPGCRAEGEFRAPGHRTNGFDGPGEYRWFCLEHVREFNSGYDWFDGMNAEEILSAQSPTSGWATESPAFRATGGVDGMPHWADFDDPLDAIGARVAGIKSRAQREAEMANSARAKAANGNSTYGARQFSAAEAQALDVLGLGMDTDRRILRRRYSDLVRRYHPDRNGGDRQYEARLTSIVEAYQLLRKSAAFL
ncbi:MAG: J domain-containing protein [Erythrobacter sp.]